MAKHNSISIPSISLLFSAIHAQNFAAFRLQNIEKAIQRPLAKLSKHFVEANRLAVANFI
jgi:hypothetical protein